MNAHRQCEDWLLPAADDLLTEAVMLAQSGFSAIIYVEGNSDSRLLDGVFVEKIKIIPAGNCDAVESVVRKYDEIDDSSGYPVILGFADRDYKAASGGLFESENMIYTHLRDIECVMLSTAARSSLISEFASTNFQKKWKRVDEFFSEVMTVAREIAVVRIWSFVNEKGVNFKNLDIEKFHAPKTNKTDVEKLINHLRGAQKASNLIDKSHEEIVADVSDKVDILSHFSNDLLYCRGHDVLNIIALYFKKGFGRSGFSYCGELLEGVLRVGSKSMLKNTKTFDNIQEWFFRRGFSNIFI